MFQTKLPETIADEHQDRRQEGTIPDKISEIAVEEIARGIEGREAVWDDPRKQDGDGFGVDRERVLREEVVVEDEARDWNRVDDPEGGDTGDKVEGDEDESAAQYTDNENDELGRSPVDAQVDG